jgi:hypothetical protein
MVKLQKGQHRRLKRALQRGMAGGKSRRVRGQRCGQWCYRAPYRRAALHLRCL